MKTVIFKPTYRCNLKCTYCYEKENRDAEHPLEMTKDQACEALTNLLNCYPDDFWEIIWHGGEPSIVGLDYIQSVITDIESKFSNIHWAFQTNGTLLTDEWLLYFKEKRISIGSSWDGFDNNITRQSKNFFDLLYRCKKIGTSLGVIYTLTPENSNNIIKAYQFAKDNKISLIFNTAFGINLSVEDHIELANKLIDLFDYICISENAYLHRPFDEIVSFIKGEECFYCEGKNCVGDWFGIHPDGGVFSCGKPWPDETQLGNVFINKDNLKETIENSKFRKIIRDVRLQQLEECKKCKYVISCRGRCPFTGFNGINYSKDYAQCAFTKTFYDGCLSVLFKHLKNNTLINSELLSAISMSNKIQFKPWKNYKSPLMAI